MTIIIFTKHRTYKFNNVTTPYFDDNILIFDYFSDYTQQNMKATFYLPSLSGYSISPDNEL